MGDRYNPYIQSLSLARLITAQLVFPFLLSTSLMSAAFSAVVTEGKQDVFIDASSSTDKHL